MPNPLQASAVALGQKAAAAAERRAQAKEVLAHKKSLQKDMRKILLLSNKIILLVPPMVEKLEKFVQNVLTKVQANIDEELVKSFEGCFSKVKEWKAEAAEILKRAATNREFTWEDVTYKDEKSIAEQMKLCNQSIKNIQEAKRKLWPNPSALFLGTAK